MAETKIEWTATVHPDGTTAPGYTMNPWIGCQRVAPGCQNCYAESFAKRTGMAKWGPQGTRVKTSDDYWLKPISWNHRAERDGVRRRVFCASLADVFEAWDGPVLNHRGERLAFDPRQAIHDHFRPAGDRHRAYPTPTGSMLPPHDFEWSTLDDIRRDLFALIDATPRLDWLLLTKRPENILRMTMPWLRDRMGDGMESPDGAWRQGIPVNNLWLGSSISDQPTADRNVPLLLESHSLAPVLFLSAEPLLGPIDLRTGIYAIPPDGVNRGTTLDGISWTIIGCESGPKRRPMELDWARRLVDQCREAGVAVFVKQLPINGRVSHEPEEWPEVLRVREWPVTVEVAR